MNKILIAEDNEDLRLLMVVNTRKIFPTADIWTAKDGLEAWKKFITWKADLVVTDLHMPNMKGDAFATRIREGQRKDIPIILLTSTPEECKDKSMFTVVCDKGNWEDFKEQLKTFRSPVKQQFWNIWSEGYSATGEHGTATFHGTVDTCVAPTFKKACAIMFKGNNDFSPERMTHWGCELFDNEQDARKGFG